MFLSADIIVKAVGGRQLAESLGFWEWAVCGGYAVFSRSCRARSANAPTAATHFPRGVTYITNQLAFSRQDGQVTYFNGHMPVFSHAETDIATFRMITSPCCDTGHVKQSDIIRAFGRVPRRHPQVYRWSHDDPPLTRADFSRPRAVQPPPGHTASAGVQHSG
jgi:hypothetical protein